MVALPARVIRFDMASRRLRRCPGRGINVVFFKIGLVIRGAGCVVSRLGTAIAEYHDVILLIVMADGP